MSKSLLFAIDAKTEEIIVSESLKGSNQIRHIERIKRDNNALLYFAVLTLTHLASSTNIDISIFKAMDKVCQSIYFKGTPLK
jgi:hypothetical protein